MPCSRAQWKSGDRGLEPDPPSLGSVSSSGDLPGVVLALGLPNPATPALAHMSGLIKLYTFLSPTLDLTCTLISGKLLTGLQGSWVRAGLRSVLTGRVWCQEQDRQSPWTLAPQGWGGGEGREMGKADSLSMDRGEGRREGRKCQEVGESYCPSLSNRQDLPKLTSPVSAELGPERDLGALAARSSALSNEEPMPTVPLSPLQTTGILEATAPPRRQAPRPSSRLKMLSSHFPGRLRPKSERWSHQLTGTELGERRAQGSGLASVCW